MRLKIGQSCRYRDMAFPVGKLHRKSTGGIKGDKVSDGNEYRLNIFMRSQRSAVNFAVYDDIRIASGIVSGLCVVCLFIDAEVGLCDTDSRLVEVKRCVSCDTHVARVQVAAAL